jgi:hypothetical protein
VVVLDIVMQVVLFVVVLDIVMQVVLFVVVLVVVVVLFVVVLLGGVQNRNRYICYISIYTVEELKWDTILII